jgi:folate-binding protein YgfZ
MTDTALAATPASTPLGGWLTSSQPQTVLEVYRGSLTPQRLDAPETETAALASGAALHDLGWLRRFKVRGEDRFRWLSGMVTNTVSELPPKGGAWNLVLNAQGRIQGDLMVWRKGEKLEIEIAADQLERLLAHLNHFIIMDDVELVAREDETAVGLSGPKAGEVLARLGLPALPEQLTHTRADWNGMHLRIRRGYGVLAEHYELWTSTATAAKLWKFLMTGGATPVGFVALDAFRIAEGIPAYGVDMVERYLPQETSQLRALHFSKGCYLGQEIVERIRSRAAVHRHLRELELDGPLAAPGTDLMQDEKVVGHITSSAELPLPKGARRFALAMVRADAETGNVSFAYTAAEGAGTARLLNAPPAL